jgi:hypothetical protein
MTKKSISRIVVVLICVTQVAMYAPLATKTYYSCHKCRNLKDVSKQHLFGLTLSSEDELRAEYPIADGHIHDWWRYSRYSKRGFIIIVGESIACTTQMYRDNKGRPKKALTTDRSQAAP